ncbi:hypothetical protein [Steroidobacter cummioxidans]|uniref:hypothetical protein n=1 Tax=Steroidobacter cummioxidans TaxID=1803913 RepID=UPI000E318FA8|nr:hypothetical protein [Steroidobacter cummioxidans]
MKTSKFEKLELELAAEEEKLKQHLLRVLPEAAESGSNVFTNTEFNPSNLPSHLFGSDAEILLNGARECLRLRRAVGLDSKGSVGAIFLEACQEHASRDPQARGPRKLASSVLRALGDGT